MMLDARSTWVTTYSGSRVFPGNPDLDSIKIEDIAHSLSLLCRYNGHVQRFYSVAEHCVLLHDIAPPEMQGWALMHDASEAYLSDIPAPLKGMIRGYRALEETMMTAICSRFGLAQEMPPWVSVYDKRMVLDEVEQATTSRASMWTDQKIPAGVTLEFWEPERAKREFLARATKLDFH